MSNELSTFFSGMSAVFGSFTSMISSAIVIAAYVFGALGLMAISKRRGIEKPWMAWVPIANAYLAGKVAEDYELKANGREVKFAKKLLILGIILAAAALVFCFVAILVTIIVATVSVAKGELSSVALGIGIFFAVLFMIALLAAAVAYQVFYLMALWRVFRSCKPGTALLFLILSIFVSGIDGVFLFLDRNYDEGMPTDQPTVTVVE